MPKKLGFTLLELSIVVSIIALLIGGIVMGQSMIEGAAIQAVAADFDKYRNAALAYKSKYGELPGDHSGAVAVSGVAADAGCQTPAASITITKATCNGNGDGVVGDNTGDPLGAQTNYHESLWFWQHLTNAGLIAGAYNGRRAPVYLNAEIILGINAPETKIDDASFNLRYFPTNTTTGYFKANYGHVFFYGEPGTVANLPFNGAALTSEKAMILDTKIDDGKPGLGKVLTSPNSVSTCATTDVETTALYNTALTGNICALILITGF